MMKVKQHLSLDYKISTLFGYIKAGQWRLVKRWFTHLWQRITRGFDDSETWDLGRGLAKFIIPRLEKYIEFSDGFIDDKDYILECKQSLRALELIIETDECPRNPTEFEQKEIELGLKHLAENMQHRLWW